MSKTIEIEIPENLVKAAWLVEDRFGYELNKIVVDGLHATLEAGVSEIFESYQEKEQVPIMVNQEHALFLNWWYKIMSRKSMHPNIGEFLMSACRKYTELGLHPTEEDTEELEQKLTEIGIRDLQAFSKTIESYLN